MIALGSMSTDFLYLCFFKRNKKINFCIICIEYYFFHIFQKPEVLGNKVEMQLTKLIEQNDTLLRFGIACEFPDARIRIHEKLQENNDSCKYN